MSETVTMRTVDQKAVEEIARLRLKLDETQRTADIRQTSIEELEARVRHLESALRHEQALSRLLAT